LKLSGRVALITGGARRVGRAIVEAMAQAGCDVAIHYLHSDGEAQDLAAGITGTGRRAVAIHGDLNDPASWSKIVQQTVASLGRIDILVNNASIFRTNEADTIDAFKPSLWETMLRTNLVAVCGLCHHAKPHLEKSGRGRIVNLCDVSGDRPWPDHLAYCASKAGLVALTKALARGLAPDIQVNGVAPGIALFPEDYTKEERERLIHCVPLARPGTPKEIAAVVRFLVETADYMTGEIIRVDGGRHLR